MSASMNELSVVSHVGRTLWEDSPMIGDDANESGASGTDEDSLPPIIIGSARHQYVQALASFIN